MTILSDISDPAAVSTLPTGISINTMMVDFPDAATHRTAKIFGNRNNNIPVRVRFKILKTENGKVTNVSDEWKDCVYLYDTSTDKGLYVVDGKLHGTVSDELHCSQNKDEYTLGFYEDRTEYTPVAADGTAERLFYVRTKKDLTALKVFVLGAFLSPDHSAAPDADGKNISRGEKATVTLTAMAPIDYANPSAWSVTEAGVSPLSLNGSIETKGDLFELEDVSGSVTTWRLRHSMLQNNSPIRLTVSSSQSLQVVNDHLRPQGLERWVAYDQNTQLQSHKTRYNGWIVPRNGAVEIRPALSSEVNGLEVYTVHPIALPGSDKQNQNTQDITVMQATMTISNDYFITKTGSAPTGSVSIQDNVGHFQTLRVTCSSTDGKPVVTG